MFEEVSGIYVRAVIERFKASARAHACCVNFSTTDSARLNSKNRLNKHKTSYLNTELIILWKSSLDSTKKRSSLELIIDVP